MLNENIFYLKYQNFKFIIHIDYEPTLNVLFVLSKFNLRSQLFFIYEL